MTEPRDALHSAEFFGPERDFWWNTDHLELIASRLQLGSVRSVLDVGCGVGHWGRLLGSVLPAEATLLGVDREPAWVLEAATRAQRDGLANRFQYEEGIAEALAYPEAGFDLVTCQTLLIHVASPRAVIQEMLRVTKPGGVILAAEPNNRASLLVSTSMNADATTAELIGLLQFMLTCERGKAALGEGHNSIGDLLPGYLAEHGAVDVQTFVSDKAATLVPPYSSEEQQVLRARVMSEAEQGTWGWSRRDASRYFMAGGGTAESFDLAWEERLTENRRAAVALSDGTFHTAGGNMLYVVTGRKPAQLSP